MKEKVDVEKQQEQPSNIKKGIQVTRYDAVFWVCIAQIGGVYCAQQTPTLHDYFKYAYTEQYTDLFEFYFNLSQTISLSFLVLLQGFLGMLCDKYSSGIVMLGQAFFVLLGQFFIITSIYFNLFWFFFFGRILIVLSVQTILTSSKIYLNSYISDENKGFLLGIQSSIVVGVKFLNLILDPHLINDSGLMTPLIIALVISSISFIASNFCLTIEQKIKKENEKTELINIIELPQKNNDKQIEQSQWEQILEFDKHFWVYCFVISTSLLLSNILDNLLPAYLSSHWSYDTISSTQIASIITVYGFINWLMGMILDWFNKDYEWLILASISQTIGFTILSQYNPLIGSIIAGLGYNMRVVVMIPLLNKLVIKSSLGKAYGLIRSAKDFLAMISFLLISIVVQSTHSYQTTFQASAYISILILIASILLFKMKDKI